MAKRNKGGKTPSAKAARNLEALKKAKEAVEASAKVDNQSYEMGQEDGGETLVTTD